MSMNTGTHPAAHSHQSHTWRDLWLLGQQVRLLRSARHQGKVTKRETETSTPRLTVICCDSSLNICMHIHSHSLSQMHGTHRHTHSHVCAHSDTTNIVHSAFAYRKRPNDLVFFLFFLSLFCFFFSSQRLMTLSVPREHQKNQRVECQTQDEKCSATDKQSDGWQSTDCRRELPAQCLG